MIWLTKTNDAARFNADVKAFYGNLQRQLKSGVINVLRREFDECHSDSRAMCCILAARDMGLNALAEEMTADYNRKIANPNTVNF